MSDRQQFDGEEFLSMETFRKTGVGVKTPLWFAEHDGELLIWTDGSSGKVKRIRNNPDVRVAPCKRFGEVTGEWVAARASVDESSEGVAQVAAFLRRKIGVFFVLFRLVDRLRDRRKGGHRVCVRVSFPDVDQP